MIHQLKKYTHRITDRKYVAELTRESTKGLPRYAFVSTAKRNSTAASATGFLYKIALQKKKIVKKIPISLDKNANFWNDRGGNRGGRGLIIIDKTLIHATSNSLQFFSLDLKLQKEIKHRYMCSNHEICLDDDGIWVTSTLHDLVVKFDFEGNLIDEWWGSKSKYLQKIFNYSDRKIDLDLKFDKENFHKDYDKYAQEERLHVNAVQVWDDKVFVLSNRKKTVIQIRPTTKIFIHDTRIRSPHNLELIDGYVVLNDTRNQFLRFYDLRYGLCRKTIVTKRFTKADVTYSYAGGWQRGVKAIGKNQLLVGTSPAELFVVNYKTHKITYSYQFETDPVHCIHGVATSNR